MALTSRRFDSVRIASCVVSALTGLLLFSALLMTYAGFAETLVIKGSDTLGAKLVPTLAEEYRTQHPAVSF